VKKNYLILFQFTILLIAGCGSDAGNSGVDLSAQQEIGVIDEALRSRATHQYDQEYAEVGFERNWSKWDEYNDVERLEPTANTVNSYPPDRPLTEDDPIYEPEEVDLCQDYYYKLCKLDLDCEAGYVCDEPSPRCHPISCFCEPETGDTETCTKECLVDVGTCIPGEREDVAPTSGPTKKGPKGVDPDLSCNFQNINPNPVSYCKPADLFMEVTDSASATMPQGCSYYLRVTSSLDGVVTDHFLSGTFSTFATILQERIRHMSLGNHNMCFQIIRDCDATYQDSAGNTVTNPYAGQEEFCEACYSPDLVVELPELNGEFCGMSPQDWYSQFQSGVNCVDERDTNVVVIEGTSEDDLLLGNKSPNRMNGKGGDDCIYGFEAMDTIRGGFGDDYIDGGSNFDRIKGQWGRDLIYGGEGDDKIWGGSGMDNIYGQGGRDDIRGDSGADYIEGGDGNDIAKGEWGNDVILGGDGDDELRGGFGKDTVYGEYGNDRVKGGTRRDRLFGNAGNDFLMGDGGRDTLYGGDGGDRLCGNWSRDYLNGEGNTDRCNGGPGLDTEVSCEYTAHESACTEAAFNSGLPVVPNITGSFCGTDSSVWITEYLNGAVTIIDNRLGSNVNITGTAKPDLILGNSQGNRIKGKGGNDCIYGYAGNDDITSDLGNDIIYGGIGADKIDGGMGNDTIFGEEGNDTLDGGMGSDSIFGGPNNDFIKGGLNNDSLRGDAGNDTIKGDAGNDSIWGGAGNDSLHGETGNDTIWCGSGNDSAKGGWGNDTLYGEAGRDKLKGNLGNDTMLGGSGDDMLVGDVGKDKLYGEAGYDRLCGNAGADYLNGGSNTDKCRGGWGSDSLSSCENNASYGQCTDSAWNNY